MYDLSRNVNVGAVVLLDIRRWGRLMTLVLPALQAPPPVAAPWPPGQVGQTPLAMIPAPMPPWHSQLPRLRSRAGRPVLLPYPQSDVVAKRSSPPVSLSFMQLPTEQGA